MWTVEKYMHRTQNYFLYVRGDTYKNLEHIYLYIYVCRQLTDPMKWSMETIISRSVQNTPACRKATEPVQSLQLTLQLQTLPSARSLVHQAVEVIPQQPLAPQD